MRGRLATIGVALGIALALAPARAGASLSLEWYLLRGRSNMQIGNYKAAVEAFEHAVAIAPDHREASRSLALAYQRNGETDRAVAQLDRYLARWDDEPDLAFEQARRLSWARYAYRRPDAIRYYRLGLARRDDPEARHDLARLLAADRADLDAALAEYRTVLAARPDRAAWRAEYRRLLLWDDRRREEATQEWARACQERPDDLEAAHALARLLAKDPHRLPDALERYDALLARRPDDVDLRLERARALARARGRRADAVAEYRRVLAARPTREVRLEYAQLLAADPETRGQALPEYEALARTAPADARTRIGYARLLGERRETSPAAAAQYQAVLARDPRNAEAHEGLALAYAWSGDVDRALDHADRAVDADPRRRDAAALRERLREGREPAMGGGLRGLTQGSGEHALDGAAAYAAFEGDVSPYARTWLEAGGETWRGPGGASADGAFAVVRAEARPSATTRVGLELGWHGARPGADALLGAAELDAGEDPAWTARIERFARTDSLLAMAGGAAGGVALAPATEQRATLRAAWRWGPVRADVAPEAGFVSDASGSNLRLGARAGAAVPLVDAGGWKLAVRGALAAAHYAEDRWAVAPVPGGPAVGGYFSPDLLLTASPRLELGYEAGATTRFALAGGPALQVQHTNAGAALDVGGDARAELTQRFGRVRLGAQVGFDCVAGVYTQLAGGATLALVF